MSKNVSSYINCVYIYIASSLVAKDPHISISPVTDNLFPEPPKTIFDIYHTAGMMNRRHVQNVPTFLKNTNSFEFHDHIWNHQEKCIQMSTNMTGIGSLIRSNSKKFERILRNLNEF